MIININEWADVLFAYNFEVKYIKRIFNHLLDLLSRVGHMNILKNINLIRKEKYQLVDKELHKDIMTKVHLQSHFGESIMVKMIKYSYGFCPIWTGIAKCITKAVTLVTP
jgi:hypothetical protein